MKSLFNNLRAALSAAPYVALIITGVFFLFLPGVTMAAEITECDPGTIYCSCPPMGVAGTSTVGNTTIEECTSVCTTLRDANNPEVHAYLVQCKIAGALTPIAQGELELTFTEQAAEQYYAAPTLGVKIPGLTFTDAYRSGNTYYVNYMGEYINAVYTWLLSAASLLAVVMIMIGGLQYTLARGDSGKIGKARDRMSKAVIGMVILMLAYAVAFLIDPATTQFKTLEVAYISQIQFDYPNETTIATIAAGSNATLSSQDPVTPGVGWNESVMYDQTDYPNYLYGDNTCTPVPPSKGSNGSNTIYSSGCGVTSYAMVASTYLKQSIDPMKVGDAWRQLGSCPDSEKYSTRCRACNPYDVCGGCNGTRDDAFTSSNLAKQLGVTSRMVGEYGKPMDASTKQEIYDHLRKGNMAIVHKKGHYVVAVGLDENGNLLVNDPWGGKMKVYEPEGLWAVTVSVHLFDR